MSSHHPSKDINGSLSNSLSGKKIVLAVCGSVAAVNASEVARLLIRHCAEVIPVVSEAAMNLVGIEQLHWATANRPITKLTGEIEHVYHCGNCSTKADLLLIFPATANTISKIACGIDDTVVTTFATTAIGEGLPTLIVPAMHISMYNHPIVRENINKLNQIGVKVLKPNIQDGKAKAISSQEILDNVTFLLQDNSSLPLKNKKVLITSGGTVEKIDPFRVITNQSSGKMGSALANAFLKAGAEVTIISGTHSAIYPDNAKIIDICSTADLAKESQSQLEKAKGDGRPYDYYVSVAAVSDWRPSNISPTKISTDKNELQLTLVPTIKIIDQVKSWSSTTKLIAFRAIDKSIKEDMLLDGKKRLEKAGADMICINPISQANSGFNSDFNEFYLLDKNGNSLTINNTTKENCAHQIVEFVCKNLI